jgi:general stress protein 26
MKAETKKALVNFIKNNRICVFATMIGNVSPHAAVIHYSMTANPVKLYFSTDDRSTKVQNLMSDPNSAVALGWSEVDWITVQMRGASRVLTDVAEIAQIKQAHYAVHPNSQRFENDPHNVFIVFEPSWIRYSDLGVVPEIIEETTDSV